jgi:hypothetical protein
MDMVANLVACGARNADAARLGEAFQPCSHIDAVAQQIAVLRDHITHIEADAELDPAFRGNPEVAFGDAALDRQRATQCLDDAGKLGKDAVASSVGDPSTEFFDCGATSAARIAASFS